MTFLFLYQVLPLALFAAVFLGLGRLEAFRRHGPAIVLALGAALQLWLWWSSEPALNAPDSRGFWALSRGEGVDLRMVLYRPRLYPWFLSLFPSPEAATLAQCLLKVATGWLVLRLARRLGGGPAASTFAGALFLPNAHWLAEPLAILDTTLFTFLFTLALSLAADAFLAFSPARWLALCAACGLASLSRQAGDISLVALLAAVAAPALLRAVRLRSARTGFFLVGGLLLASALAGAGALANGIQHGVWKRSVALGVNLYTHSSYFALAAGDAAEWDFVEARLPGARARLGAWESHWRRPVPWPVNALPHELERALGSAGAEAILAADRALTERFIAWVEEYPESYLASAANEAMRLLWKSEEYHPRSLLGLGSEAPAALRRLERGIIHQPPGLLILSAALLLFTRRPAALLPALGVAAYLAPLPFLQLGFARYALPALPALLALGAAGAVAARNRMPWLLFRGPR